MSVPPIGVSNVLLRLTRYRTLLLTVPLLMGLVVGVYSWRAPPVFTAYARLLPPQTNASSASALLNQVGGGAALGAAALALKNPSDMYASLFVSRTVQDDVIDKFSLATHYRIDDIDTLRVEVFRRTKVEVGKDGIITLSYTDTTGAQAAAVTNGLIDAMYRVARRLAREDDARRQAFYDGLIREARQAQKAADIALLELEKKTGLTRLKGQEEAVSLAIVELRGMIATREVELRKASATATSRHPEVIRMRSELAGLRAQLGGLEQGLEGRNRGMLVPFGTYAESREAVAQARRDVETAETVVMQLTRARELSRGDETRDLSVLQILDSAVPPTRKSGPRVVANTVAAMVVGILLAAMLGLTWDILFTDSDRRQRWKRILPALVRWSETKSKAP